MAKSPSKLKTLKKHIQDLISEYNYEILIDSEKLVLISAGELGIESI